MNKLVVFFTFCLLASLAHAIEIDFCVADTKLPRGPEGYACRHPSKVTTDDFVFTGFRGTRTFSNGVGNNVSSATANEFPALNGLGLSMSRLDLDVNGIISVHSHRTSEILLVIRGSIIAGFIDTNNNAYYKRLEVGDVMVFPQAMLHFQVNVGSISATMFSTLNGANPGFQFTMNSLFASDLTADEVQQITQLSKREVQRMKTTFGSA